jgi:hypothetical protein
MKKWTALLLLLAATPLRACPACEAQQPKLLRGITHGVGPQGDMDYLIVSVMVFITLATLWYSVKTLIRPKEDTPEHIKYSIFE